MMKKLLCLLLILALLPVISLAEEPTTLRIAGFLSEDELRDFLRDNPDVRVESSGEMYYSTNEMIQALLTGDATYDVMVTSTETINLPALLEKGFAAPLNDSAILTEAYEGLYPFLQEAVSREGVIYGLPMTLFYTQLSYLPANFEAVGLPVPETWEELAALVNAWPEQSDEARDAYEPFLWGSQYRSVFLRNMLEAYASHMQASGEALRFDTPLFRELMGLVDTLTAANDKEEESDDLDGLMQTMDVLQTGYDSREQILDLVMDGRQSVGVTAMVLLINPYSQHIPEAIRVLEYLSQHYTPAVRLTLMKDGNGPVAFPDYEATLADWEREHAALKDEEALAVHQALLEDIERYHHWQLTQETIDAWQAVAPHVIIQGKNALHHVDASGEVPVESLICRYLDGQLPMEQFILQMDEKCMMMTME